MKQPYRRGCVPKPDNSIRRVEACRCTAYSWPHRPGGGLCRWPEEPEYRLTTLAGTPAEPRVRTPLERCWANKELQEQRRRARRA